MSEEKRKILVPIDFAASSNKAFLHAREMVKWWEGELHVIHVLDTEFMSGAVRITIEPLDESIVKWKKRAEDKLKNIYHVGGEQLQGEIHIREGKPHEEILKLADELGIDMIVIGSHGRKGLERAIFGSVAEKVTRLSKVPVLVVK